MNLKLDAIRFVAPVFVAGAALVALSSRSLDEGGHFSFEPNPGALAKSPYGRTVGMALQGPITRFWDLGVGSIEGSQELDEAKRPDERLFNWVCELRDAKTEAGAPSDLSEGYRDFTMARIENKLSLAWKMDPRNFANYAIYQMFLWEGFNDEVIDSEISFRALSQSTLEESLNDKDSPFSLLTAGQAAYDMVFAARTSKGLDPEQAYSDINTYSNLIHEILGDYEQLVATMQSDGRWEQFSDAKKSEFAQRRAYLESLKRETNTVVESLTKMNQSTKGDHSS